MTEQFCAEYNRRDKRWSAAALERLARHAWPGNVRELKNVVERAVIMEIDDTIETVDLFDAAKGGDGLDLLLAEPTLQSFQRASEIAYIRHHLAANNWNVAATARAIETPRSNLYKKMQAYGITREDQ
jgi:two-component system nitrogen regulation response regulator NtrX